jgi:NAD(P)-dependent dehydrogenase (short-subunit alcohol dehydrogenase family)
MDLNDRTAVVTGAASGIGLALTKRFLREGMSVVMADIEADVLDAEATKIAEAGGRVRPVVCDVSDPDQIADLRDQALSTFGAVHVLCNNAGVASGRPNLKSRPAEWQWVIGVNVLGVAYGVSAFAPLMVEQGEGHIVNTASEAGLTSSPMLGSYHASKYAVVGLSESLALELAGTGVGVSCLCPELVNTKIFESTRNAPEALGFRPPAPVAMADLEKLMGTVAMDPADVAADVAYAIRADQFWILTHSATQARVQQRNDGLEAGRNPGMKR